MNRIYFSTAILYLALFMFIPFPFTTLLKPLPIICLLIWSGKQNPKLSAALFFSALGDIALTWPQPIAFQLGMVGFILAHLSYIALFSRHFLWQRIRLSMYLCLAIVAVLGYVFLLPAMGTLAIPVLVYLCILLLMVFFASQVQEQGIYIFLGAALFLLSDSLIGVDLFFKSSPWIKLSVMASYYLAQWFLAKGSMAINGKK